MEKIHNEWVDHPKYNCFGCSPTNPMGLHMEFMEDGDDIVSQWTPNHNTQGWIDVLHGGIQATLADEIASWVVFRKLGTTGVTSRMELRYMHEVSNLAPYITLRAHLTAHRHRLADIEVLIEDAEGRLCTRMQCTYFLASADEARKAGFRPFRLECETQQN
ncbi:MAG: PaaI family thioesterase [Bacteroidales bacterium]|nr:PaaI family thioesterase [Bacteroidales bacterium]